jgi:hypothetical protein
MATALFGCDRLRTVLPRLQQRHREVAAQEYLAQWRQDYEALKVDRDALAAELLEFYPAVTSKITNLFTRIAANDAELSQLHQKRPAGVGLHLAGAELVARDLTSFSAVSPPLSEHLKLPDFEHSDRLVFPPPQPSLAAVYAMSMMPQHDPRYTADWAAAREADNVSRAANESRWADEESARQLASRQAYEASLRR